MRILLPETFVHSSKVTPLYAQNIKSREISKLIILIKYPVYYWPGCMLLFYRKKSSFLPVIDFGFSNITNTRFKKRGDGFVHFAVMNAEYCSFCGEEAFRTQKTMKVCNIEVLLSDQPT
uniref:Uncharacterized protein n=1 Tax=Anguilla anguilla TaxID=7936 RepID=A0A0E9SDZ6_ANGAN